MNKVYVTAIVVALIFGITVAVVPEANNNKERNADEMMLEIIDDTRFINVDEIAHVVITNNPGYRIIDVRTPAEFEAFSLPGAINIPLDSILNTDNEDILNQSIVKNVFYSNGTVYANQAWMLTSRLNYNNNYVLQGGLNNWFATILNPQKPKSTESAEAFAKYQFRKAAMQYFTGGGQVQETEIPNLTVPVKNVTKKSQGGGC